MFNGNRVYKIDKNGNKKRIFCIRGIKGLRIKFIGKNSTVIIYEPMARFKHSKIICGNNCYAEIKSSSHCITWTKMMLQADNSKLYIGEEFSSRDTLISLEHEPNLTIEIGNDVMSAAGTQIRTTDAHAIYDNDTKKVLNIGKNVKIGNHVWFATGARVLKGVTISDNVVIGMNSIVTKDCEESCIYAGSPAKIIKTNINWDRKTATALNEVLLKK